MPEGKREQVRQRSSVAARMSQVRPVTPYAMIHRLVDAPDLLELQDVYFHLQHSGQSPFVKSCLGVPFKSPAALYNHAACMPAAIKMPRVNFPPFGFSSGNLPEDDASAGQHYSLRNIYQTTNLPLSLRCNMSPGSSYIFTFKRPDTVCQRVNEVSRRSDDHREQQ